MSRTCGLAWRSTGVIAVDLSIFAVVDIPFVRSPCLSVRQFAQRIFHFAMNCAELLAEFRSADRADFHALAAGNALFRIHMGTVCASGHVGSVVKLGSTDGIAYTGCAIADTDDLVFAVNVCNLMNKAVTFRALKDFKSLLIGDIASHAAVDAVFSHVADTDAEFAVDFAASLAAHFLLFAAGALADGILVILA